MRAVAALLTIPGADKHPQLNEFITQVGRDPFTSTLTSTHQPTGTHDSGHPIKLAKSLYKHELDTWELSKWLFL